MVKNIHFTIKVNSQYSLGKALISTVSTA